LESYTPVSPLLLVYYADKDKYGHTQCQKLHYPEKTGKHTPFDTIYLQSIM